MTTSLPVPRTALGRRGLRRLLAEPRRALLAVDFDGTLAPIVPDPDSARAEPAAVAALARLGRRLGAVAVVTGRPAERAVVYGGFAGVPGLERLIVLGHYGAQRWDAAAAAEATAATVPTAATASTAAGGRVTEPQLPAGVAAVRRELPAVLAAAGAPAGTRIEDKGRSLAVHTRQTASPAEALARLDAPLRELAARHGLQVEPGRMVVELRPRGVDKGEAMAALIAECAPTSVLYAGDDLGDVAAFEAVAAARARGAVDGVLVYCAAVTGEEAVPELEASADVRVAGPVALGELLTTLADGLA